MPPADQVVGTDKCLYHQQLQVLTVIIGSHVQEIWGDEEERGIARGFPRGLISAEMLKKGRERGKNDTNGDGILDISKYTRSETPSHFRSSGTSSVKRSEWEVARLAGGERDTAKLKKTSKSGNQSAKYFGPREVSRSSRPSKKSKRNEKMVL